MPLPDRYAEIRSACRRAGRPISPLDAQIAAIARGKRDSRGLARSRVRQSSKSDAWSPSKKRGPGPARAARSLGL